MIKGWSHRRLASATRSWLSLFILSALLLIATNLIKNDSLTLIVTIFFIYTSLVVGYQMFMGDSGIVSFGHVAFFGIGAYTAAVLNIPPEVKAVALPNLPTSLQQVQTGALIAILFATILSGMIALLIGVVISRMKENAMGIATFALLVIMYTIFNNFKDVTRGGLGLYGIPDVITPSFAFIGFMIIVGVALLYKASPIGLLIQGAREDPLAAKSLGNNLVPARLFCFVISAMVMGTGGGLWAQRVTAFGPATFFFHDTFNIIVMMIIGGQASVSGAIFGSGVITVIEEIIRPLENGIVIGTIHIPQINGAVQFSLAVLILVTLILRPEGIMGGKEFVIPFSEGVNRLSKWIRK